MDEVVFVLNKNNRLGSKSRYTFKSRKHADISIKHTDKMRITANKAANLFTKKVAATLFIISTAT